MAPRFEEADRATIADTSCRTGRVLLISLASDGFGGLEAHVLNLARQLHAARRSVAVLARHGSALHERAVREGISCVAVRWLKWVRGTPVRNYLLTGALTRIGKKLDVAVFHCNNRFETPAAISAASRLGAKCLLNYHVPDPFDVSILRDIDAFVSPSLIACNYTLESCRPGILSAERIRLLPPVIRAEPFLCFSDSRERMRWMREELGLDALPDCPIVCMVGNMVADVEHKNYPLLFEALAILIHRRKYPVVALLVGDGPASGYLRTLAEQLRIASSVHFLGHRSQQVPGVMHMSDLLVLASRHEAFGMVLVEAGLVGRPAVAARNTGAEQIIVDRQTGLLFENGDSTSLADAMESILRRPEYAKELGANARRHTVAAFDPATVTAQYINLYDSLLEPGTSVAAGGPGRLAIRRHHARSEEA